MDGWIKLHRKILDSPMYKQMNSKQRDIMITLLLMANHESNEWLFEGKLYKVKPGEFITSVKSIKEKCAPDVSTQNIRTCLLTLEKYQFLTIKSTNKNTLISLVNWAVYQNIKAESTNELTNDQQTTNKQLTTNNNERNKEHKNTSPDENSAVGNPIMIAILEEYCKLHNKLDLHVKSMERIAMISLSHSDIPLPFILECMRESYRYKTSINEPIRSFAYYPSVIKDAWEKNTVIEFKPKQTQQSFAPKEYVPTPEDLERMEDMKRVHEYRKEQFRLSQQKKYV